MIQDNTPKKHHYIPRFLLKNFTDEEGHVYYWNIENSTLEKRSIKSVFMNLHMYRDEINHEDNPTYVEGVLGKFEQEISVLINDKMLKPKTIELTRYELERLRIYFTLQAFRDDYRKEQYVKEKFDESTKKTLLPYTVNGDFEDLWKREIEEFAKCKSYKEIKENNAIDPIMKLNFLNNLQGFYMSVVDLRGGEVLVSDVYPTLEVYKLPIKNINIHMHEIIPISSTRIILLNHIMFREDRHVPEFDYMTKCSQIKGDIIKPPKNVYENIHYTQEDKYIYNVRKMYDKDIIYINTLILNEARKGIIFRNPSKVIDSIIEYNNLEGTKQTYEPLLDILNK